MFFNGLVKEILQEQKTLTLQRIKHDFFWNTLSLFFLCIVEMKFYHVFWGCMTFEG